MRTDWLKSGRQMWYVFGNISKEDADRLCSNGVSLLNMQSVPKESLTPVRIADLDDQSTKIHRLDITVPDPTNENSAFISYY